MAARPDRAEDASLDNRLMVAVQTGDVSRLGELFERHHRALFAFFLRLTGDRQGSEDLVQDVFLRMLKYRATYQPGSQFRTWMYTLARHAHIDRYHGRSRDLPMTDRDPEPASRQPMVVETMERDEQAALLRRALARLAPDKRELLVLSRFQGLKYEEIAAMLGCEVGAVKVRVFRAVRALRAIVEELSGDASCRANN